MLLPAHTLSVSIARSPGEVYAFISDAMNLPRWATAFCLAVRPAGDHHVITTPAGEMTVQFAAPNDFGVADHIVRPAPDVEVRVPLRVIPNETGSEVLFTLFQTPDISARRLAEDRGMVERDLATLKRVLET